MNELIDETTKKMIRNLEIDYTILQMLDQSEERIGAVTLEVVLKDSLNVSQATIGRRLIEFDKKEYTCQLGFKGRRLTKKGQIEMLRLYNEIFKMKQNRAFLKSLNGNKKNLLIESLEVRRVLEKETTKQACKNILAEHIAELQKIVENQHLAIIKNESIAYHDFQFHNYITKLAGNKLLYYIVNMIKHETYFSPIISYIRKQMGSQQHKDHAEIVSALASKDSEKAALKMEKHISNIINDVNSYWRSMEEKGEIEIESFF